MVGPSRARFAMSSSCSPIEQYHHLVYLDPVAALRRDLLVQHLSVCVPQPTQQTCATRADRAGHTAPTRQHLIWSYVFFGSGCGIRSISAPKCLGHPVRMDHMPERCVEVFQFFCSSVVQPYGFCRARAAAGRGGEVSPAFLHGVC